MNFLFQAAILITLYGASSTEASVDLSDPESIRSALLRNAVTVDCYRGLGNGETNRGLSAALRSEQVDTAGAGYNVVWSTDTAGSGHIRIADNEGRYPAMHDGMFISQVTRHESFWKKEEDGRTRLLRLSDPADAEIIRTWRETGQPDTSIEHFPQMIYDFTHGLHTTTMKDWYAKATAPRRMGTTFTLKLNRDDSLTRWLDDSNRQASVLPLRAAYPAIIRMHYLRSVVNKAIALTPGVVIEAPVVRRSDEAIRAEQQESDRRREANRAAERMRRETEEAIAASDRRQAQARLQRLSQSEDYQTHVLPGRGSSARSTRRRTDEGRSSATLPTGVDPVLDQILAESFAQQAAAPPAPPTRQHSPIEIEMRAVEDKATAEIGASRVKEWPESMYSTLGFSGYSADFPPDCPFKAKIVMGESPEGPATEETVVGIKRNHDRTTVLEVERDHTCKICLGAIKPGEQVAVAKGCGHFNTCAGCAEGWLASASGSKCLVCQQSGAAQVPGDDTAVNGRQ